VAFAYTRAVRHARSEALDRLADLLDDVRSLPGLVERSRGVFHRQSKAYLHFHEDWSGLYADVRLTGDFERFRIETAAERSQFLDVIRSNCSAVP
jgi:hypothetical protein